MINFKMFLNESPEEYSELLLEDGHFLDKVSFVCHMNL